MKMKKDACFEKKTYKYEHLTKKTYFTHPKTN